MLIDRFISWATRRRPGRQVVTFAGDDLFTRYEFLRWDEMSDGSWDQIRDRFPIRPGRLPWWMPFNAFLHHWEMGPDTPESFHDHPRWSITVCLKGRILERTPWGDRLLKPGSIVFRTRKAIHAFQIPADAGDVWTLFIVGRRKHRQNSYEVMPR